MEVTANAVQTVESGQNIIYTATPVACPCGNVLTREDSGLLTLRGGARYLVTFGANIGIPATGTAGAIDVSIALDGEALPTTQMIATPAKVSEFHNVCRSAYVSVPRGCCYTLSVQNTSGVAIEVQNANLIVERV